MMGRNVNELQEEYEKEFSEFLVQKIIHAGGSLQFQHLSGLLQQLRFEIRDAFGVTKSALMKFLRSHSNTFKLNSKGMVTIINSSTFDSREYFTEENCENINVQKTFLPYIEGIGHVYKLFSEYAIIKTTNPIQTYIYFTPVEYNADKDSLFVDFDLCIKDKVCFKAIHGYSDYEIEYRATKVWKLYNSDDEKPHFEDSEKTKIAKSNKFTGEGIIKKLFSNVGFIAILGKENKEILFYKSNVKDPNIKCGVKVEFVAEYISKEWQATKIIKKKKNNDNESLDHSHTYTNAIDKCNAIEGKIRNEPGKIYPYSKGAIIKFGENYSQLADGNKCNFFLYEIKVKTSDVLMEFSEGDDVKFDAIKSTNSPGWKAVLAWIGKKPSSISENDIDKISDNTNEDISDDSSKNVNLLKTGKVNFNNEEVKEELKLKNKNKTQLENPVDKNLNRLSKKHQKNNISKMLSHKLSYVDSNYGQDNCKYQNRNRRKSNTKYNQVKSFSKLSKIMNPKRSNKNLPIWKNFDIDISESSETTSEENNELQDYSHFPRKFLKEDKQPLAVTSKLPKIQKTKIYDSEDDEVACTSGKMLAKGKSSIQIFEAIDGEIIQLCCKFAFIKSSHLKREVEFILNSFYLNGQSVEEQQVSDLREVLIIGDTVKFNCFKIIDDFGEIHQKVTVAWKGQIPNIHEIKPEEFILENDLSVSIGDKPDYECESEESFDTAKSTDFEEDCDLIIEEQLSLNNRHGDNLYQYPMISNGIIDSANEQLLTDYQNERLPDKILKKLEAYGFTSSTPEVVINVIQEIINLVLESPIMEESSNLCLSQDSYNENDPATVCSSCRKTNVSFTKDFANTVDSEVQTIVTGEIFAISTFTET